MLPIDKTFYTPVLRLKQGEYLALADLANDVKDCILPHIILPPPSERDPERGRRLTPEELIQEHARRIGAYWTGRTCLIDARFLGASLAPIGAARWLPDLFDAIERARRRAIPVANLSMNADEKEGIRLVFAKHKNGLALRITLADLADGILFENIKNFLLAIGIKPSEVILLMDFTDAGFDDPDAISELIVDSTHRLQSAGQWRRLVFEGTHYPITNPAPKNGSIKIRRNEWIAWKRVNETHPELRTSLFFGDFAADNASFEIAPKRGGGRPIPHLRYALPDEWLIARGGPATENDNGSMQSVAKKILDSGHFAGEAFSAGDEFIADCALGKGGVGSPSIWRKVNIVHHITHVVKDLADERQVRIGTRPKRERVEQTSLFAEEGDGQPR
jgi:Beta protein